MQINLALDDFAQHVGQLFDASADAATMSLELISATPLRGHHSNPRSGFSLVFRGAMAPTLAQCTYRVVHPAHGEMDIFLVPIGPDGAGMRYEAIFN
jgi:hypothetical protein